MTLSGVDRRPDRRPGRSLDRLPWALTFAAVLAQLVYPLMQGPARSSLTVTAVYAVFAASVGHAWVHHGARWAGTLVALAAGGGLLVEVLGVHTGVPFGGYEYAATLGPRLLGVPVVIPFAWAGMAYPALLVGRRLVGAQRLATPLVAGWALASWDVFLDPQMVQAGHWRWDDPTPSLPGVEGIPLSNYAGWLTAAALLMTALDRLPHRPAPEGPPALLYLWTYASQVLANLAFFGRPSVALAGGVLMGLTSLRYAYVLANDQSVALARPGG